MAHDKTLINKLFLKHLKEHSQNSGDVVQSLSGMGGRDKSGLELGGGEVDSFAE
jgi:hypothetical protein